MLQKQIRAKQAEQIMAAKEAVGKSINALQAAICDYPKAEPSLETNAIRAYLVECLELARQVENKLMKL